MTSSGDAVSTLKVKHGLTPGLVVVMVGEDPASQVYVRSKGKQTREAGMNSNWALNAYCWIADCSKADGNKPKNAIDAWGSIPAQSMPHCCPMHMSIIPVRFRFSPKDAFVDRST